MGKVVDGARAKLARFDRNTNQAEILGIFDSVSFQINHDVQAVNILGRYTAAELVTTAVDPVAISASGWRVPNNGKHIQGGLTAIEQLMFQEYMEMLLIDRKTNITLAKVSYVLPVSAAEQVSNRSLMTLNMNYMGIILSDESVDQAEGPGAVDLP